MTLEYKRDVVSNAVINIDDKEFHNFSRERMKSREIKKLQDDVEQLKKRIQYLEEKIK